MPHQNHQQLLDILSQVKNTTIQSKYNNLVENIIEECLHTIDHDNTDTDMSDLESDFGPSDPLPGKAMEMFNSDSSS
jgi:Uma2 family endonuclease